MTAPREPSRLDRIDARTVEPVVQRALGEPSARVDDWTIAPIKGDGSLGRFVARITGSATAGPVHWPWALFLKVPNPTANAHSLWHRESFQREVRLYESGILDRVGPAMSAPRCLRIDHSGGDGPWLWLEAVDGTPSFEWPLERFPVAARRLGRMQGALLGGSRLPRTNWLENGHWLWPRLESGAARVPGLLEAFAAHALTAPLWRSTFGMRLQLIYDSRLRFVDASP